MAKENREFDAFIRHIEALDIELTVNEEGVFTACTQAEPFFCFDATSRDEASTLVGRALTSYGKNFFGLTDLEFPTVKTVEHDEARVPVTVEHGKPVGHIKPHFDLAA